MDWEPIETAPKDGTPILLFARAKTATAPIQIVGWYLPDMGWVEASFTGPVGIAPTHWQPLDDPPPTEEEIAAHEKRRQDFVDSWQKLRPQMPPEQINALFEMREYVREGGVEHLKKLAVVLADRHK